MVPYGGSGRRGLPDFRPRHWWSLGAVVAALDAVVVYEGVTKGSLLGTLVIGVLIGLLVAALLVGGWRARRLPPDITSMAFGAIGAGPQTRRRSPGRRHPLAPPRSRSRSRQQRGGQPLRPSPHHPGRH